MEEVPNIDMEEDISSESCSSDQEAPVSDVESDMEEDFDDFYDGGTDAPCSTNE